MEEPQNKALFYEVQQFDNTILRWIFLVLGVPLIAIVAYVLYSRLNMVQMEEDTSVVVLIIICSLIIISAGSLILLIYLIKLKIWVYPRHIKVLMGPWHWRKFYFSEIDCMEIINFNAEEEFGGYGIRKSMSLARVIAYIVKGTNGIKLECKDGNTIILGSQRIKELEKVLKQYHKLITGS